MLTPLKIFFEIIMITSALSRKFPFVIYSVIYSIYSFPRQDESQRYAAKKTPAENCGILLRHFNKDGDHGDREGKSYGELQKKAFRTQRARCTLKRKYVYHSFTIVICLDRNDYC